MTVGLNQNLAEHRPFREEFKIGRPPGDVAGGAGEVDPTLITILLWKKKTDPIFGFVVNKGDTTMVFSVSESEDNLYPAPGDAYVGVNIRVGAADVASVTVPPRGYAVFSLEPGHFTNADHKYVRFNATEKTSGQLVLCNYTEAMTFRQRTGTP